MCIFEFYALGFLKFMYAFVCVCMSLMYVLLGSYRQVRHPNLVEKKHEVTGKKVMISKTQGVGVGVFAVI